MHPAILIRTVRLLRTWLWGRWGLPRSRGQNAFLVTNSSPYNCKMQHYPCRVIASVFNILQLQTCRLLTCCTVNWIQHPFNIISMYAHHEKCNLIACRKAYFSLILTGWHWCHFLPKVGYHLSLPFPLLFLPFFFLSPFLSPPSPSFTVPFVLFSLFPSHFPFPCPQIQLGRLGSAVSDAYASWSRHNAAAASHIVTSRQSVI